MKKINVIIPTKNPSMKNSRLVRAIRTVEKQSIPSNITVEIHIGVDKDSRVSLDYNRFRLPVSVSKSNGQSQAKALNAAIEDSDGELITFLEDDDQWHAKYIHYSLAVLVDNVDFVTTNQIEIDSEGKIIGILDYATPSGWLLKREAIQKSGAFNENFQLHLDNEFLGRAKKNELRRIHMVEKTAPIMQSIIRERRPHMWRIINFYGQYLKIARHQEFYPLVTREVRYESNLAKTRTDQSWAMRSRQEYAVLRKLFGKSPW